MFWPTKSLTSHHNNHRNRRTAVITGIGAVAPNGIGKDVFWEALKEGRNAVDRISFFDPFHHPSQVAGEVRDFDATAFLHKKELKRMGRSSHLAVAAAQLAVADARLTLRPSLKGRMGVIIGTGAGGTEYAEDDFYAMKVGGVCKMRPFAAIAAFGGALSSEVSRSLGLTGFSLTLSTGCTGSTDAMGIAMHAIRYGMVDVLLTGGADACVTPGILGAFCQMGATSSRFNDTPKKASRPFNKDRDGFVIGEGAWMFVFEELGHARRRNARIYAEISGYGATCDAYHMSRPEPSGRFTAAAIREALHDANLAPNEIEHISAYGNATPVNDSYETMVFKKVFEKYASRIPINSVKSMIGHPIGACGAAQVAAGLLPIVEGVIPPTINYEIPDPECDLDYVPNVARNRVARKVLINTLAFGAKNSALVVSNVNCC